MNRVESKKSKFVPICTTIAVLIVATIFIFLFPFHSSTAFQISFVTATNDPVLGPAGIFCATNVSGSKIHFYACPLQTKIHGTWSQLLRSGRPVDVPGHSSVYFTVACDTNSAPWRVPVRWWYDDSGNVQHFLYLRSVAEANVYYNWQSVIQGRKPRYILGSFDDFGYSHIGYSPAVTNK